MVGRIKVPMQRIKVSGKSPPFTRAIANDNERRQSKAVVYWGQVRKRGLLGTRGQS